MATASVLLYAFVLMDNHFHLLVRTPRANLSRFMQRLSTSDALYARYKHRRPGHRFKGRFNAKLVENDTYLRALTRYIPLNPIKTAACRRLSRRERVRRLESYRWSSYRGYVDARQAVDFVCYDVLKMHAARPASPSPTDYGFRDSWHAGSHWGATAMPNDFRDALDLLNTRFNTQLD